MCVCIEKRIYKNYHPNKSLLPLVIPVPESRLKPERKKKKILKFTNNFKTAEEGIFLLQLHSKNIKNMSQTDRVSANLMPLVANLQS